eukprot:CAMPEP_0202879650 /NCGR_PEP_ID=MMETSP1391-20130828/33923_1 /ASSEMBLY_ACC=CAM_ASM_000867 /TAXON_ID=1034604 /ORGANISM="Chlamydomonas leiostraca, Strain SAG 11-49" /LENGTH=210 /DNA_ID=CAMNT_0049562039 /DNA_START=37 /DNA_END=666 /DNA_ORIENTATION=+
MLQTNSFNKTGLAGMLRPARPCIHQKLARAQGRNLLRPASAANARGSGEHSNKGPSNDAAKAGKGRRENGSGRPSYPKLHNKQQAEMAWEDHASSAQLPSWHEHISDIKALGNSTPDASPVDKAKAGNVFLLLYKLKLLIEEQKPGLSQAQQVDASHCLDTLVRVLTCPAQGRGGELDSSNSFVTGPGITIKVHQANEKAQVLPPDATVL